ncbi:MAG TPA: type I phosphomannose isomerase catalytic subunit [Planctomycetota bacterium]|nr:type I phosphomannose isomerase catalytic subunit [Planctomycetota bacterium]
MTIPSSPLFIKPVLVERVWGGNRLQSMFGKPIPAGKVIGESWELCDRADVQSVIAEGTCEGRTLADVIAENPAQVLGKSLSGRFPLLVKYIDAGTALSVQVHPDDAGAKKYNDLGKSECWVVLHAEPGAEIIRGLKPGTTREDYASAVAEDRIEDVLNKFNPRTGDLVALPAGMVHAIGAGLVVAEIQQSSDITFRIYDYKRLGLDGKPRKLHIDEALSAIKFDNSFDAFEGDMSRNTVAPKIESRRAGVLTEAMLRGKYFTLNRYTLDPASRFTLPENADAARVLMAIAGSGKLGKKTVRSGQTLFLPACCGDFEISSSRDQTLMLLEATPLAG